MSLYNWPARITDPDTSHEAAKALDTTRLEAIVLDAFKNAPNGLTQDELGDRMPAFTLNTITPRLAPLVRKGFLRVVGKRPGRSGRNQRVLKYVRATD